MDQYRMIDSKDFISFVAGFSAFAKKVLYYLLSSVRSGIAIFIVILVATSSIGLWHWYNTKPYYEAQMACTFNDLTKKAYGEMIHNLDILVKDHSYNNLAVLLNISPTDAHNIISIEGKNMAGSMLYEDITPNRDLEPFYIDVKTNDNKLLVVLQPVLINYLNTASPLSVRRQKTNSAAIQHKMAYFKTAMRRTDSIISEYRVRINKTNTPTVSADTLASLIASTDTMDNRYMELRMKEQTGNVPVQILHGFVFSEQPVTERNKALKITVVAAIIFACSASVAARVIKESNTITKSTSA
ncbi:MAG: hypothetical protein P4L41_17630 [Flavipsychrobacter sp.]|nr:hypothetical protein [Flavipsychrobacter sp.]